VKITHGRVRIRAVEHHTTDYAKARAEGNRISRVPTRGMHGADYIFLCADQSYIQRTSRNALRGMCQHRVTLEALLMLVVRPGQREKNIGQKTIRDEDRARDSDAGFER